MDTDSIIKALAHAQSLPREAIQAASQNRTQLAPLFVERIERFIENPHPHDDCLIFFLFHMLGDYEWKPAYPTLACLLQLPPDRLYEVLGDGLTETAHRVMANVFNGDPLPLYSVIEGEHHNQFIRSGMFETLAMVTLQDRLNRDTVAHYLKEAFATLRPRSENFVWYGWQRAIVMLGLKDLAPLVEQAFEKEWIDSNNISREDFVSELDLALHDASQLSWFKDNHYMPFGDTIAEFSHWRCFAPDDLDPTIPLAPLSAPLYRGS